MRHALRASVGLAASLAGAGCELQELTIVDVEDVVVAEVYVEIDADSGEGEVRGFLHRTVGRAAVDPAAFAGTLITVRRQDGVELELAPAALEDCLRTRPEGADGACFRSDPAQSGTLAPGDALELVVSLPDGTRLLSATRVPGDFELIGVAAECRLEPDRQMEVRWTRATDAWAYVNETSIEGLPAALAAEGIEADDPLYLLGLSISASDTTIVFPGQFGLFDRIDLDQDLALRLQEGLPEGSSAQVAITAVDRNYVNWVRGGNFNPSGQVRVPSIQGDGTGVFGATLARRFIGVSSAGAGSTLPECPLGTP